MSLIPPNALKVDLAPLHKVNNKHVDVQILPTPIEAVRTIPGGV